MVSSKSSRVRIPPELQAIIEWRRKSTCCYSILFLTVSASGTSWGNMNLHRRHLNNTACTTGEGKPPSPQLSKIPTGHQSRAVDSLQDCHSVSLTVHLLYYLLSHGVICPCPFFSFNCGQDVFNLVCSLIHDALSMLCQTLLSTFPFGY